MTAGTYTSEEVLQECNELAQEILGDDRDEEINHTLTLLLLHLLGIEKVSDFKEITGYDDQFILRYLLAKKIYGVSHDRNDYKWDDPLETSIKLTLECLTLVGGIAKDVAEDTYYEFREQRTFGLRTSVSHQKYWNDVRAMCHSFAIRSQQARQVWKFYNVFGLIGAN